MKIAVWHNLNSGGGKRALYYHVKGLIERGHTVVSYCPDTVDQSFLPLSDLIEEKIYPLKQKIIKRTNKFHYLNSRDLIFEKTETMLDHCKECANDINTNNFDVLFANSSSDYCMAHIGRFVNIPKVIYLGEPYRVLYEAMPNFLWKAPNKNSNSYFKYIIDRVKHLYKTFWYSYLCREEYISALTYDEILVNSIYSKECIKRCYNLDSKICYLGIDVDKFSNKTVNKENYIVGLGMIVERKGIERAIDSISCIEPNLRPPLIWIGNKAKTEYLEKLKTYAESKGVQVTFKTFVSDQELISFLSAAAVLLYLPNLEPFGLAPLEACASGTAVIGIAEGGVKETIKDGINGYIVEDFSPIRIAEYIMLFKNLNFAKDMGKKAKTYVEQNWNSKMGIDNIESHLLNVILKKSRLL
jgi:glycosyltransferase involved in cell wall biosynthesis